MSGRPLPGKFRPVDLRGIPRFSVPGPADTIRRISAGRRTRINKLRARAETP